MIKNTVIIVLVIVLIYLYYQNRKFSNSLTKHSNSLDGMASEIKELDENSIQTIQEFTSFLQTNLNSNNLEELKSKLGEKSLDELIEENQDYETEVDTLTRTKNSLEADLLAQSNAFQNRLREKDREVKKLKEDLKDLEKVREKLTSEKQQHKGSLERIAKLTEQITNLEKEKQELSKITSLPGEFPQEDLEKKHQEQLRKINLLFDEKAKDYETIDFEGLYNLLEEEAKKKKK